MLSTISPARYSSLARCGGPNTIPVDFDAAAYPILSRHWFSVEPLHPINTITAEASASLRRHRQFEHVHKLGPRAVEELTVEIAGGEDLDRALEAYQRLTPELLEATGGDRFPAAPIYKVS